jgi:hypothetical protein
MYVDARKFDYSRFSYPDADRLIERDKDAARTAYLRWIDESVFAIVERQWEIQDIGAVQQTGDFIKLLKEAEFTYALGAYISVISLVGVCAEDLCRFFANSAGHNLDSLSQDNRIKELVRLNLISQAIAGQLHTVRRLRNDCLHYNAAFKQKDAGTLKADALASLNEIKAVYAQIMGVIDYRLTDASKTFTMINAITEEASANRETAESALARTRNVFAAAFGFDLSMNSARPFYTTSIFSVLEVDTEINPAEISLRDMGSGMIVIVDLVASEIEDIQAQGIEQGDVIAVSLMSVPNELEVTGLWRLTGPIRLLSK